MGLSRALDDVPHGGAIGMKKTVPPSIFCSMYFALDSLDKFRTIQGPTLFLHIL